MNDNLATPYQVVCPQCKYGTNRLFEQTCPNCKPDVNLVPLTWELEAKQCREAMSLWAGRFTQLQDQFNGWLTSGATIRRKDDSDKPPISIVDDRVHIYGLHVEHEKDTTLASLVNESPNKDPIHQCDDAMDATAEMVLEDAWRQIIKEKQSPYAAFVIFLWDEDTYSTNYWNAGLRRSQVIALLEFVKFAYLQKMHNPDSEGQE